RRIDFEPGPKKAKLWGLVCLPTNSRQPRQPENQLAGQPEPLPGNQPDGRFCLPSPFRGKQQPSDSPVFADQRHGEAWDPDDWQSFEDLDPHSFEALEAGLNG